MSSPVEQVYDQIFQRIDSPFKASRPAEAAAKPSGGIFTNESLFKGAPGSEKHEANLISELSQKLNSESKANAKMSNQIADLRRALEEERTKTGALEEQFRSELKETKLKENEALKELATHERKAVEIGTQIREQEERHSRLRIELERMRSENDVLRGEMKRMGEVTATKLLELENGINNVSRMREFEVENFEMEKANITNTGEFVVEQMRLKFTERLSKLDEQIGQINAERDRFLAEGKQYYEALRTFNGQADARLNAVMARVRDETSAKNEAELSELRNRIAGQEEELANQSRKNAELLSRFQTLERDAKARVLAKKNESLRMKEELAGLEQTFNKLLVGLNAEEKEVEKKQASVQRLEADVLDIRAKSELLAKKYGEEMREIKDSHSLDMGDLDVTLRALEAEEASIASQIADTKARTHTFQKQHNSLIDGIQNNLSHTLDRAMPTHPAQFDSESKAKRGRAYGGSENVSF